MADETRSGSITIDKDNRLQARLPDGFTSGDLEILRGDLSKVLYDATRHDAEYVFDDSIREIHPDENGVEVTFVSGAARRFDYVVGADSLHSNVRAIVFGKESDLTHPMGYYIEIYTVLDFLSLGDAGLYYVELGRRVGCFGTPRDGRAKTSFYFASKGLDYDRRDVSAQKNLLRQTFAGMKWETQRML